MAWLRRFAGTTPGVLSLIAVLLAGACVLTGVVSGGQLDSRIARHDAVLDRSEPLAYAAQDLYAELSAADAAAAASFLSGGIETSEMRDRYKGALADASAALADVTAGATDIATRTAAADISLQLATYAGLVESARVNNRQGFPVGSAYLREASALMQNSLLPGAQQIFEDKMAALDRDQRAVGSTPIVTLVLLVLVIAAIVVSSVIATRRTNRTFNLGLLVCAGLVVGVAGWVLIATVLAGAAINDGRAQGNRYSDLAEARILVQQVRTDETLQLIARGDITASEKSFNERMARLQEQLQDPDLQAWGESHRRHVEFYLSGDYGAALNQAIGPDPNASAAQFGAVEADLRDGIEETRAALRDDVARAGNVLSWSPTATLVLMVLAAAAAVVGLWPRLKEFL
ncbi:hypothetical protein BVC93_01035 [Mycobacterium sp. MS1601]|nr:hypothetical protein BVC93_01035 [Mycobacterium sp. MS1601]